MADEYPSVAAGIQERGPAAVDLTKSAHLDLTEKEATALVTHAKEHGSVAWLTGLREFLAAKKSEWSYFTHLVTCNALSKAHIGEVKDPVHISMVFAVYGEVNRICTSEEAKATDFVGVHPNGEDFLRAKVAQLDWLVEGSPVTWSIMVCDDGCDKPWTLPNGTAGSGSGKLIEVVAAAEAPGKDIAVVYLADGIAKGHPVCTGMTSPKDSRKGGAVHYGMQSALEKFEADGKSGKHLVAYTDADLSTHLGQTGLLLQPILEGKVGGVGSRRHALSILVKSGTRNVRGVVNAFLWKQMLQEIGYVMDTQTAFKGFDAEVCKQILNDKISERAFGFDVELLLKSHLAAVGEGNPQPLANVPICWQDSEAESQSGDESGGDAYVKLLQGFASVYRINLPAEPWRDSFASFLDDLTAESWGKFLATCPEGIALKTPGDFTPDYKEVTAEMCRAAAGI